MNGKGAEQQCMCACVLNYVPVQSVPKYVLNCQLSARPNLFLTTGSKPGEYPGDKADM